MTTTIPATREAAIAAIADQDAAKWGEQERAASLRINGAKTYGLALNTLAASAELAGHPDTALRAAADAALTDADWRYLRSSR